MTALPRESSRTIDRNDFVIGVLSVTAVVLFVSLLLVQWMPRPALGSGMTSYGGNFVMTVGALSVGDAEVVYIIDTQAQRMVAYRFDSSRNQIALMQGVDLAGLRGTSAVPVQTPPATKRSTDPRQPRSATPQRNQTGTPTNPATGGAASPLPQDQQPAQPQQPNPASPNPPPVQPGQP